MPLCLTLALLWGMLGWLGALTLNPCQKFDNLSLVIGICLSSSSP